MSDKQILHIAPDEKFINAADYLYEKAFPGKNTFFIIKPPANPPLKYIEPKDNFNIYVRDPELDSFLLRESKKFQVVVFHGLDNEMIRLFNTSEEKEKFVWTFWGAEIYNSDLYKKPVFGPKTRKIEEKIQKGTCLDKFKDLFRKIKYRKLWDNGLVDKIKAMKEIRYIAMLNEKMDLFEHTELKNNHYKTIPFTYYPLEYLFNDLSKKVNGNNILLGNSSSTTNNHLEMIDILSKLDLGDRKVITPLSYGRKRYANIVVKYGRDKLGSAFHPLTEFKPRDEYYDLIKGCGIVIMNHYRSQGVGTIIGSLYMGAKVYLNDTPFYRYLKRLGCRVNLIHEDLITNYEHSFDLLTPGEIDHNRNILEQEISTDSIVRKMRNYFNEYFKI